MPSSYFAKFSLTSPVTRLSFVRIHLSASDRLHCERGFNAAPSIFISTKREAFHILFIKLRVLFTLSSEKRISPPLATPLSSEKRSVSAPYASINSNGSTPLPRDLDILRPSLSRTMPCIKTSLKGGASMCSKEEKIIRATQKKIMS